MDCNKFIKLIYKYKVPSYTTIYYDTRTSNIALCNYVYYDKKNNNIILTDLPSYVKKVYLCNENDDKNFYHINKKSRKIKLTRLDGELDDTLYDLVQAGLVEKVEQN